MVVAKKYIQAIESRYPVWCHFCGQSFPSKHFGQMHFPVIVRGAVLVFTPWDTDRSDLVLLFSEDAFKFSEE